MLRRTRRAAVALATSLLLHVPGASAADATRLVVKYAPRVNACAHCLLARGVPFAAVTGTDSLDRLNRELGVRGARALFLDDHTLSGDRRATYAERMAAARTRFPARSARAAHGASLPDLSNVYVLELPAGTDAVAAAARYAKDPDVVYAQLDARADVSLSINDPFLSTSGTWGQSYADLWGLATIGAPLAWNTGFGAGAVVAVVDTGVKYTHRDLKANIWVNPREIPHNHIDDDGNGFVDDVLGWDFIKERAKPRDQNGHGTHVAGTIAAVGNNGRGIAGVAYGARIMALRGLDKNGSGYVSDLARAIAYAAENGADVINNSWGAPVPSAVVADAVATAHALGAVVVFAAGNQSSRLVGDAGDPNVIAVAATDPTDARAGFSNWGDAISVAAPGVDILSTSGPSRVGGVKVRGGYRRLSGTSMAAPHVAGLAAVLLASQPALTPEEVRWHLELNADQPGYPGYDGEAWNPYLGFGRISAARVFDPPPVTTRLRSHSIDAHAFAGDVAPLDAPADFLFTTLSPVSWTLGGSSWIVPAQTSGSGAATVPLTLDTTTLAPGRATGAVTVSAPAAADGGASMPVSATLHADTRIDAEILVAHDVRYLYQEPHVGGDGTNAVVLWLDGTRGAQFDLVAAPIAPSGTLGPTALVDGANTLKDEEAIGIAFDGTNYLVAWREQRTEALPGLRVRETDAVKAVRLSRALQVLDPTPLVLATRVVEADQLGTDTRRYESVGVAFDGTAFTVLWAETNVATAVTDLWVRRVAGNGALSAATTIYPAPSTIYPQLVWPKIACTATGTCMVSWVDYTRELIGPGQSAWVGYGVGVRLAGTQPLDAAPVRLLDAIDVDSTTFSVALASDGAGFLLAGTRNRCAPTSFCAFDGVATRVTAGGVTLDPAGIVLNDSAAQSAPWVMLQGLTFDGTSYVTTFVDATIDAPPATATPDEIGWKYGFPLFAARVSTGGSVLDAEPIGLLVHARATALSGEVAATSAGLVAAWVDTRALDPSSKSIYAQRFLAPQ